MAQPTIEVQGLGRLESTLAALARALPDVSPDSAARVIGQTARMNAPKRTGRLASSWAPDNQPGALGLTFGAAHAAALHWGVGARVGLRGPHNIRPSLYLLRAIESTQAQWVAEYQKELATLTSQVKGA